MGVKCHPCVLKLLKQWHDKYEVKGGADRVAYTHITGARGARRALAALKAALLDLCCCPALLHRLFQPPALVKASRRSVPIVLPCMWKYQLMAVVFAGTAWVSSLVYPALLGLDVFRNTNHEPPCAFLAPVEPDGVVLPRFHIFLPLIAQPHRPLSKVHEPDCGLVLSTTLSMHMSPV